MNRRVRWYRLEPHDGALSPRDLAEQMQADRYTARNGVGFALQAATEKRIEGRFVERRELVETVEDPLGRRYENRRIVLRQFSFHIRREFPQLEILDPSPAVPTFVSHLIDLFGNRVVIEPARVDLQSWLGKIEAIVGRVQVCTVVAGEIALDAEIGARIFVHGSVDVRDAAAKLLKSRSSKLERIEVAWRARGSRVSCTLRGASALFDPEHDSQVRPVLRSALSHASERV